MRKFFGGLITVSLLFFLNAANASAYSYAIAEDPMAVIFKAAVNAAKEGKWDQVSKKASEGIAMQKGHLFEANHLQPSFQDMIGKKDVSGTAEVFANLVYISIVEKLHRNQKEKLKDIKNSKDRMVLARKTYLDILDGNVKKENPARSVAILNEFQKAFDKIGNPGLFGIGKKDPDPAGYEQAVKKIEEFLLKAFPGFKA